MKKKHDIEYCGLICRYNALGYCFHPDLKGSIKFEDGMIRRSFPEFCPLEDVSKEEEKK